jgi:hypothetical protein
MNLNFTNNFKKKLQFLFKKISSQLFSLIYGKIKNKINIEEDPKFTLKHVKLENRFYKIYFAEFARLYTDTINDTAIIINNSLLEGPSFQLRKNKNAKCEDNIVFLKGTPRIKKKLNGTVLSLLTGGGGNENYWHWLFDVLPRLFLAKQVMNLENIDFFLFPSLDQKFQIETLDILGIPTNKRLSSTHYRHIEADKIIVTDHPYILKNDPIKEIEDLPLWISDWLKESFVGKDLKSEISSKRFFIDRKDSISNHTALRNIKNEAEIKTFLKNKNFEIISLKNLSFNNCVQLFNNAEFIIGLHGAGFANLSFCKPSTKIIEFRITAGKMYENLAKINNLKYDSITAQPENLDHTIQLGSIDISKDVLETKINNMN